MTLAITRKFGRPSWMTPYGHEGFGDVFFDRLWPEWQRDMGDEWVPSVDFSEKDGKYHLTAELPGMSKDDIAVSIDKGYVTVSGKKEDVKEEEKGDYYVKESRSGSFCRRFRLPVDVDTEHVDASYKDGILTVVIPHKEGEKAKKIDVR